MVTAEQALLEAYGEGNSIASDHYLIDLLERFAREKCKEQREICFSQMKHHKFGFYKAKKDDIINAPEPELRNNK